MSKTIDERVVEMRFDNKSFENNVKTTISTLDKLKQSLRFDGATKGFDDINTAANRVDMSSFCGAVETVRLKFSALEVMAVTALANITNSAINAGKQLVSSLSVDQISAGWTKFGEKTVSVGTLISQGYDMDTVTEQLERLNWFTDETSYNFTDMVSNIAKFTAAGQELEPSVTALEGIATWAALSGQNASKASQAMYQLSQAMGAGVMRKEDYKSIQNVSMDTDEFRQKALDAAVAVGTLRDNLNGTYTSLVNSKPGAFTKSQFADHLTQDAWFTSDVMMQVFNDYSAAVDQIYEYAEEKGITASQAIEEFGDNFDAFGLKAFKAAQEARTWGDVVDSVKDAVSTGWMNTFELIFGNYEQATKLWTKLANYMYEIFAEGGNARNELLEEALGGDSKWNEFYSNINKAGVETDAFQEKVKELAKNHNVSLDEMIEQEGSFEKALQKAFDNGSLNKGILSQALRAISEEITDTTKTFEECSKIVNRVIRGDFGNGQARVEALTKAGYDYATIQSLVNKQMRGQKLTIDDLSNAQLKNLGYTEEQIEALRELADEAEKTGTPLNELIDSLDKPTGRELLIDALWNALDGLKKAIDTVKAAWSEIFPPMTADRLYEIIKGVNKFSTNLLMSDETADKLKRTLKGLFAILDLIRTITGGGLRIALKLLCKILGMADVNILDLTASIGDTIVGIEDWIKKNELLNGIIDAFVSALSFGIDTLGSWIRSFRNWIGGFVDVTRVKNTLLGFGEAFYNVSSGIISGAVSGVLAVKDWIQGFMKIPEVEKVVTNFKTAVSDTFKNVKDHFSEGIERIKDFIDRVKEMDGLSIENIQKAFSDFKVNVFDYFIDTDDIFNSLTQAVKDFAATVKEKLKEAGIDVDGFKQKALDLFTSIKQKFSENIGLGEILTIVFGTGLIITVKELGKAMTSLGKALSPLTGLFPDFRGFLSGVGKNLKDLTKAKVFEMNSDSVLNIAKALAVLAGSLWVLAQLPTEKLWSAVGAIVVLGGALAALSFGLSKLNGVGISDVKSSFSLTGIASAIFILILSLKQLESLDQSMIESNLVILGSLMAALVGASIVMSRYAPQLSKGSFFLLSYAGSVKLIVSALKDLEKLEVYKIEDALIAVLGTMGTLAAISRALSAGSDWKSAVSMIGMVISLKLLISTLDSLKDFNFTVIEDNIRTLIVIFGIFAGLMAVSHLAGQYAAKAGLGILAMSVALILIIETFKMLSKVTFGEGELGACLAVVSVLLLMFGAVTALSHFAGANAAKAGLMLIEMAGAILVITAAMVVLSHVDSAGLQQALVAIVWVIAMFGLLVGMTSVAKDVKGSITAFAVAIGVLAVSLATLSMVNQENLRNAAISLSIVMGMFAVIVAATGIAQQAVATLVVMTIAVAAMGAILYLLSGLPVESVLGSAAALSMLLLSLSAAMVVAGASHGISLAAVAGLAVMELALLGLAKILMMLNGTEISLETVGALSLALIALVGAFALFGGVAALLSPVTPAIMALSTAFVIFGAGCALIGAGIWLVCDALTKLAESGQTNAESIKASVAAIVSGIIEGLVSGLLNGIGMIVEAIINVGKSMVEGLKNFLGIHSPSTVFESLGKNTIDGLINGIKSKISSTIESIKNLGRNCIEAIKGFFSDFRTSGANAISNVVSGIKSKVEDAKSACVSLINSAKNAVSDKFSEWKDVGKNLISGLKEGISSMAGSLVESAKGVVDSAIRGAKNLLGIHSPSKVFAEIGRYVDLGFIEGLRKFSGKVADATEYVGENAIDAMSRTISGISDIVSDNIDTQPTIRPVIDLTDIQNGANAISGMFNNPNLSLAGTAAKAYTASNSYNSSGAYGDGRANDGLYSEKIVSAINQLREDFGDMSDSIRRMQVRIDGGALVGEIIDPIDTALGKRANYSRRRN